MAFGKIKENTKCLLPYDPIIRVNKMLSVKFLMLLILFLMIKTINASTVLSDLSLSHVQSNKCERLPIMQHCPELKYNQTMISNFAHGDQINIEDAEKMVNNEFLDLRRIAHETVTNSN